MLSRVHCCEKACIIQCTRHTANKEANVTGNVMVRASDTDVLVILLGMIGRHSGSQEAPSYNHITMDCGSGNHRRYIDVSTIATNLESSQPGLAAAMPGLHAMTGCDFTSAFYRKGKVKPLKIVQRDDTGTFVEFFSKLSSQHKPDQRVAEEFICCLYGMRGDDVNEARHNKLLQLTGRLDRDNPMANAKKTDCALLPSCVKTVTNKLRRAHFVSIVWGGADTPHPGQGLDPQNYGWKNKNGYYSPDWFAGQALPNHLFQEEEPIEDLESDQPDVASEADDSASEPSWSDDSEDDSE